MIFCCLEGIFNILYWFGFVKGFFGDCGLFWLRWKINVIIIFYFYYMYVFLVNLRLILDYIKFNFF